ncbi:MAG TPA: SPOR domain-containing protein [Candidatus Polarisedimenticolia bacterium]|nr:SPOR domain-containing protein [Candidatus Polarisedimenticolia bacterium]
MSRAGRLRSLVLSVLAVSLLLLAASRWAGQVRHGTRPPGTGAAARPAAVNGDLVGASTAPTAPASDLSFYKTLGDSHPVAGGAALEGTPPGAARATGEPPADSAGAWIVQALATKDAGAAGRLRDRLAARGLPAVLSEGRAGRVPIYRVRLGPYRERAAAEAMARRLRSRLGLSPWILKEAD